MRAIPFTQRRGPKVGATLFDKMDSKHVTLIEILDGTPRRGSALRSGKPGLPTYYVRDAMGSTYGRCAIYFAIPEDRDYLAESA